MARVTESLLAELNALNGVKYPEAGFFYWGDVSGWGRPQGERVWVCLSNGGVDYSSFNDKLPRNRCDKIRRAIDHVKQIKES
jgi:hypothetical protein